MKIVCITNDVEATTIQGESYNDVVAQRVKNEAIPITLQLYNRYNVKATFFCVGEMVEKMPEIVQMIQHDGHEIACHGWNHSSKDAFDTMDYEQQVEHLKKAKTMLEKYSINPVISFRSPALRVNQHTASALQKSGFSIDSSIAPQRMDMFMSLGAKNKIQWLKAPRTLYYTSESNLARKGNSKVLEIPLSSCMFPYIGTFLRICPFLSRILHWMLYFETRNSKDKIVTMLFHPNELIERKESMNIIRRSNNPIVHLLTGKLRVWLKRRNFGIKAQTIIQREIEFWKSKGYIFCTLQEAEELRRYNKR